MNPFFRSRFASRLPRPADIGFLRDFIALDKMMPADARTESKYGYVHDRGQNLVFLDTHTEFSRDPRWLLYGPISANPIFPYWR